MVNFKFIMLLLSASLLLGSCKDDEEDPCVENVVGRWEGDADGTSSFGGCGLGISLSISGESGCDIIIAGLPYSCNSSSFQVRAIVSAGNITINSQPFGAGTITGSGSVYLNQLTLTTQSSGTTYQIVCSK